MWPLVQWVRGGHKVSWLNAWIAGSEPLDNVLSYIPDLQLLQGLRDEGLIEAALRIVSPGDMPEPITPEHDAAALSSGFRIDLLGMQERIALSLVPDSRGWLISRAGGERLVRDHLGQAGRALDETLLEVTQEIARLGLMAQRTSVEQALAELDGVLHGLDWPAWMTSQRLSLLKKSARILVILDQALRADLQTLSASLSAIRTETLRQLAAPARRAAEVAFTPER